MQVKYIASNTLVEDLKEERLISFRLYSSISLHSGEEIEHRFNFLNWHMNTKADYTFVHLDKVLVLLSKFSMLTLTEKMHTMHLVLQDQILLACLEVAIADLPEDVLVDLCNRPGTKAKFVTLSSLVEDNEWIQEHFRVVLKNLYVGRYYELLDGKPADDYEVWGDDWIGPAKVLVPKDDMNNLLKEYFYNWLHFTDTQIPIVIAQEQIKALPDGTYIDLLG